jgi:hypothetical protein
MKTIKKSIVFLLITASVFTSCKKDDIKPDIVQEQTTPTGQSPTTNTTTAFSSSMGNLFKDNRNDAKQVFTISAQSGGIINGNKGSKISFDPYSFKDKNGQIITTGNVTVELIEALNYKDMLLINVETTSTVDGNKLVLKSGGQVKITATSNGEELDIVPGTTTLDVPTTNFDAEMEVFVGEENDAGVVTWTPADTTPVAVPSQTIAPVSVNTIDSTQVNSIIYYSIQIKNLGWINCDRFYNTPTTNGKIILPEGCNYTNTMAWIVFSSINSIINVNVGESNECILYNMPLNMSAKIVVLSEISKDNYTYSITPLTISNNFSQQITTTSISLTDFETEVNGL